MPQLAGAYPVLAAPRAVVDETAETRWLALESLDGETLLPAISSAFFFQTGIDGLEIPPRELIRKKYPGMAGSKLKEIRTGEREVFLPTFLEGTTHPEFLAFLDRLAALFNYRNVDYRSNDGTLNLVAYSRRGEQLTERRLRCAYESGMDTGYGTDNQGNIWASYGLKFLCVQPYWYGTRWSTPPIRQEAGADWFEEFPGELSASQTLGDFTVTVEGDVESWSTVDLTGPGDFIVSGEGSLASIPAVADGEKVSLITDPRGRTALFDGVRDWARVGPSRRWRPLMPGDRELTVAVTGPSTNTEVIVSGPTLSERPW